MDPGETRVQCLNPGVREEMQEQREGTHNLPRRAKTALQVAAFVLNAEDGAPVGGRVHHIPEDK